MEDNSKGIITLNSNLPIIIKVTFPYKFDKNKTTKTENIAFYIKLFQKDSELFYFPIETYILKKDIFFILKGITK